MESQRRSFLKKLREKGMDNLKRTRILKSINGDCRKSRTCPYCNSVQGQIRKIGVLKLVHDKYVTYNKSTAAKKVAPPSMKKFEDSFEVARKNDAELDKHIKKAWDDLHPLRVLNLFKLISPSDCELLGINPSEGRPEMFLWHYIPAPPVCIRPSTQQDTGSNEDDLTAKLMDIILCSGQIRSALWKGQPIQTIMKQWEYMQLSIATYINSDVPGLQQLAEPNKIVRGFCQRLKGKQGRFRGNLSGKRVDFSGRTVISPDPNLSIEEVAIPVLVAKNLTYPERVNNLNVEKLRQRVRNGAKRWPGANSIQFKDGFKRSLEYGGGLEKAANELKVGDIVERHLEDRDIVLFNRQPSLHKLSIMAHYVKVRPWRTFRLNECVCTPYNADFDGDEMNIHVPQTEEARIEAITLMGVKNNLSTPKNGEPIISATQDFITAAYLLSSKDSFFDRKTFTNLCMYMVNGNMQIDLPPPAIIKPECLWTGKQVFSILIRPNKASPVLMNLDAKCRDFDPKELDPKWANDMCPNDGWLVIRNSEVMCGRMDKTTVGSGKKECIFYIIMRDFGPDAAVAAMDRLSKLSARYLTNQGFSIGISDVYPSATLTEHKLQLVETAYKEVEKLIQDFQTGKLTKSTGCSLEETLENKISGLLSEVRQSAGNYCIRTLSKWNSPLVMAKSGSKGSNINVAQMVAVVGQQIIGGSRVADGFQDRTLPHFPKNARQAPSKGFVRNSFFTGLTPTEFLFHAISGREGLVDTAVKTAETGYMSRRLMKSLEDLSTQYDKTVRTSAHGIVQFQFGADNLDPNDMEGAAVPVNFSRTYTHAESITWDNNEPGLLPFEIKSLSEELMAKERKRLPRRGLLHGEPLDYNDHSNYGIDENDSERAFLETITTYVSSLASKLAKARGKANLPGLDNDPEITGDYYNVSAEDSTRKAQMDQVAKVSKSTLIAFIELCLEKYKKAQVQPGHAVGAVGAQSIGEPGTQMTLKTFHFAGVAGMSITQGVPRIKEIINASSNISTPVIECPLENPDEMAVARLVKGRIEKTYLSDLIDFVEDRWTDIKTTICLRVNMERLSESQLGITIGDIEEAILKQKKLKINANDVQSKGVDIYVEVPHGSGTSNSRSKNKQDEGADLLLRVNHLKRALPAITISGYPNVSRAIIQSTTTVPVTQKVLVEGYGLLACMSTEGVIGTKTKSNSVMECFQVLGIEAARTTIADEIALVMKGMDIDPRHMQLLADVMTYKGEVLGITRFGLAKMRDSVLQLASFEKTPDHLFDAAAAMKSDRIEGVSECIIMGQTMTIGTGGMQVVRELKLSEEDVCEKAALFEDFFRWDEDCRRKGLY